MRIASVSSKQGFRPFAKTEPTLGIVLLGNWSVLVARKNRSNQRNHLADMPTQASASNGRHWLSCSNSFGRSTAFMRPAAINCTSCINQAQQLTMRWLANEMGCERPEHCNRELVAVAIDQLLDSEAYPEQLKTLIIANALIALENPPKARSDYLRIPSAELLLSLSVKPNVWDGVPSFPSLSESGLPKGTRKSGRIRLSIYLDLVMRGLVTVEPGKPIFLTNKGVDVLRHDDTIRLVETQRQRRTDANHSPVR